MQIFYLSILPDTWYFYERRPWIVEGTGFNVPDPYSLFLNLKTSKIKKAPTSGAFLNIHY